MIDNDPEAFVMRSRFYQASGKVPAVTGLVLVCALLFAGIGAFLYAWATLYGGPLLAIGMICAFPFWLVLLAQWSCHLGKIRNPGVMRQFGVVIGLVGWSLQWILWIVFASYGSVHSMPGHSLAIPVSDLVSDPDAFRQGFSVALAETEWFEEERLLRYVSWLIELCLMLVLPSWAGFAHAGRPFCETRNRWATVTHLPHLLAGDTLLKARVHLAAHPAELLAALTPLRGALNSYANVTLYTGKFDTFISVVVHTLKFEVSRVRREEQIIVEYLRVSSRDIATLNERLSRRRQPKTKPAGKKTKRAKPKNQGQSQIAEQL